MSPFRRGLFLWGEFAYHLYLLWRRSLLRPRHSANLQRRILLPFGSLPLHLTKSIIVGPTMLLNLTAHAEFLAIAIIFQQKIAPSPMELRSATFVGYWKVREQHCMTLVCIGAIGTWPRDVIALFTTLLMYGSSTKPLINFASTPNLKVS